MRTRTRYVILSSIPALVVLLAVLVVPTIFVFQTAFQDYQLTDPTGRHFVGGANFAEMATDDRFWRAAQRSAVFSAISLAVSLVAGIAIGALISAQLRATNVLRTLLVVPMVMTPLVIGAMFRFMLDADAGFISYLQQLMGLKPVAFLARARLALPTIALVDAWQWTPFVALVTAAGLERIPRSILEVARVDGASRWQEFRYVALPLIRPLLAVVILIRMMDSLREFDKVFIMTGGGPGRASETLPIYLWRFAFQYYDMGFAAAVAIFMLVVISILSMVVVRRFRALQGAAT